MPSLAALINFLEEFAPPAQAESWDNVGLLVGEREKQVLRVMTCLTITPASAAEAIEERADLIVTHHPLPFHPLKRVTSETPEGKLLLDLIRSGVAVYSPHTAFDSARAGINQRLAEGIGVLVSKVLVPSESGELGAGRWGQLDKPIAVSQLAQRVKQFLKVERVQVVGSPARSVHTVAVACGSAGELLSAAGQLGCDCFVTGEMRFHGCLEAETGSIAVILAGHFASERFAVEQLAEVLAEQLPGLEVWASRREQDPISWL